MSDDENMKSVGDVSLQDIKFFCFFLPTSTFNQSY